MAPDADPHPRDDREPDLPSVGDGSLPWLRAPLTIGQLCALGIVVVGGAIRVAVAAGGWAWLGLGLMVIIILAMAIAHEAGWTRKRRRPSKSALKRTRGRRRAAGPAVSVARGAGTRGVGRSREKSLQAQPGARRPGDGRVPPHGPAHARERAPANEDAPLEETAKHDRR